VNDETPEPARLERRITAIGAVHRVVRAIWALSRAELPRASAAVAQASAYLDAVDEVVERLVGASRNVHAERSLLVVFGPQRPYCGALSARLLAQLPRSGGLALVGQRLAEEASSDPDLRARIQFTLPGATNPDEHEALAPGIAAQVLAQAVAPRARVDLLYPRGGGAKLHRAVLLSGTREPALAPPDTYSPLELVLERALGESIAGRLVVALAEALHSEVKARANAADHARQACEEKLEELERTSRAVDQEQITNELLEIVAGRRALTRAPPVAGGVAKVQALLRP
jgi:hypothetical protein